MAPMRLDIPDLGMMDESDFESLHMTYPSSSSNSFSSASSSFGVFTPTSGRSISPHSNPESLDFGNSFRSTADAFSCGLTPPSSAVSPYFQPDFGLYPSPAPVTPSRSHEFTDNLLCNYGQQAPSQVSNFFPFGAELGPSPMPSTPLQGPQFGQGWDPYAPSWPQTDSPIDFGANGEDGTYPSFPAPVHPGRRLFDDSAKKKTTALRKAQLLGSRKTTGGVRKRTKPSTPPTKALANGLEVAVAECNKVKCDWDGCDRLFKRKEHMVRHRNANHLAILIRCEYCTKEFNRSDNFRAHESLHAQERASGKVHFVPEAAARIAEKQQKGARLRKRGGVAALSSRLADLTTTTTDQHDNMGAT